MRVDMRRLRRHGAPKAFDRRRHVVALAPRDAELVLYLGILRPQGGGALVCRQRVIELVGVAR